MFVIFWDSSLFSSCSLSPLLIVGAHIHYIPLLCTLGTVFIIICVQYPLQSSYFVHTIYHIYCIICTSVSATCRWKDCMFGVRAAPMVVTLNIYESGSKTINSVHPAVATSVNSHDMIHQMEQLIHKCKPLCSIKWDGSSNVLTCYRHQ